MEEIMMPPLLSFPACLTFERDRLFLFRAGFTYKDSRKHNFLLVTNCNGILGKVLLRYPHMDNKESLNTQKKLGVRLKAARLKTKLTQAQVATQAGVNLNFYARLERGEVNVSFERLENILKALGVKSLPID
jgi:DNA-binding XRE family transcriptional regulator